MFLLVLYTLFLFTPVITKPRYSDLDEEDQQLFRAVFDTPSYDHEEEDNDLDLGKIDLLKDGLWVIKAKLAELRAINKALVSNMLSTKLKLKDLLTNHLPSKKHQHEASDVEKKKPAHIYSQPPAYFPQYQQYEPHHPMPQYGHDPYYGH